MSDTEPTLLVADVAIDSRMAGAEAVYTYRASDQTRPGQAYLVPLGPRRSVGFVVAVRQVTEQELGFPVASLRPLGDRIEGLDLPEQTIGLVAETARQTLSSVPVAMTLATPPGIRERLTAAYAKTGADLPDGLTVAMHEILRVLESQEIVERKGKPIPQGTKSTLSALVKRGLVERKTTLAPLSERSKTGGTYRLTSHLAAVEAFLTGAGRKKPAQAVTVMRLQGSESASFTVQEIKALGQVSDQTVKALIAARLLEPAVEGDEPGFTPPVLNDAQAPAVERISAAITEGRYESFLLYGVTGSGKTEVYLRCAEEALRAGKQVLYLVPEIALTAQVIAQLRQRFGRRVAVVHSNMTPVERAESWARARSGEAPVVLGARSALFSPLSRVGLIVVDEEHEASYKQETAPRYHARQLAEWAAKQFQCPVVLGSATPSIETRYRAENGEITLLKLTRRAVASARLPDVVIEDMTLLYKEQKAAVFSPRLHQEISDTLARNEQVILFLNRRSYSPFVICRECSHRFMCPRCSVALSFHRKERTLMCHHCGYQEEAPETCPECSGNKVGAYGIGSQRVEEAVMTAFPEARVARLDRDVARIKGALEETLTKFRSRETDVLVGTQMVAKGLDFPHVTLVGVVSADMILNLPDFRASERTFQLLSQVGGRAGRAERPGRVVIQTLTADHPSIIAAAEHDADGLYNQLIEERQAADYPPFKRLVNIVFSGPDRHRVYELSAVVGQKLKVGLNNAEVLGPVDCPLEKLQDNYRRHVILKVPYDFDLMVLPEFWSGVKPRQTRMTVDVDPISML